MSLPQVYIGLVKTYPIYSAMVQFAILGTFGEMVGSKVRGGKWMPFTAGQAILKMIAWAILGVLIKYAFTGFHGFHAILLQKGMWPTHFMMFNANVWSAVSISIFTNLLFGPVMILTHRLMDNFIEGKGMNWQSLVGAWWTLIYFWIPAHSVTFSLPGPYQIGLAALWSVVLGIILGMFARAR